MLRVRDQRAGAYRQHQMIVVVGDLAKMLGYPLGLLERARAGSPERLPELLRNHG